MGVFSGPTSILSDTSITLRKINKAIFGCIFEKSEILVRDISETSKRRHGIDIFFEICSKSLKDVTQTTSFLRCFWGVSEMSLSIEVWLRSLRDISWQLGSYISQAFTLKSLSNWIMWPCQRGDLELLQCMR